ncbi:type II secretion system F family protein [Xanthobacter oligotrophicus]|uniref:type II secretion system F family protein n=1 Tax=Xanthobacter oligotrophicus TaxID=2607286 RepID=UPI0011F1C554|nr:type II secretion system F family protein [Xanthobacter oligotrophicus]MCG5234875.1 type II secretion system F family protein [Xanthobacter oligotrophicus]
MATFTYRALTQAGQIVSGEITAPTEAEVRRRIEFLGLMPVETAPARAKSESGRFGLALGGPKAEDVTLFTRDLALLLKAGARLDEALELLSGDADLGRMRAVVRKLRADVLAGQSFAEAAAGEPKLFPPVYVALVRVGEASGTMDRILDLLAQERARAEQLRRKLMEALQYPAFVLVAAGGVLVFFLLFVLPQFSTVLRDMGAKLDPAVEMLLNLSDLAQAHGAALGAGACGLVALAWLVLRRPATRAAVMDTLARLPLVSTILLFRRSAVFCRNLSILLGNGVTLTQALRIIVEVMAAGDDASVWAATSDKVRQGARLSDAVAAGAALPPMAVRMLRLGEETGQLAMLSGRIADFYEEKLQRSLAKVVAIIGPAAIVTISVVVGGLIVSVMTALLSVSQSIG